MRAQPAERAHTPVAAARNSPGSRTITPAGRFLAELDGMCAVMCVGGGILSFTPFQVARWGWKQGS